MSFLSAMSGACDSSRSIWTRLVPYAQAYRSTWPRMSSGQPTRRSFTDFWCGGEVGAGTSLNVGWRTPGNGFYLAECDLNAESQRGRRYSRNMRPMVTSLATIHAHG